MLFSMSRQKQRTSTYIEALHSDVFGYEAAPANLQEELKAHHAGCACGEHHRSEQPQRDHHLKADCLEDVSLGERLGRWQYLLHLVAVVAGAAAGGGVRALAGDHLVAAD